MTVEVFCATALAAVSHGFLGRRGGVSTGAMAGLNVGTGSSDSPAAIAENRARAIAAVLPGATLATVHQIHSAEAVFVDIPWPQDARPHADAMVTDRPDILLGVLTADCAPVLLADAEAGVVGAAHAGWRGAFGGVTDATVELMEAHGARRERIVAAVGPCIAQASYEVDDAFWRRFLDADPANERFFVTGAAGKPHFDLEAYVVARIADAGIASVAALGRDTYTDSTRFFSYRRAAHAGEPDYGRQVSLIAVPRESRLIPAARAA